MVRSNNDSRQTERTLLQHNGPVSARILNVLADPLLSVVMNRKLGDNVLLQLSRAGSVRDDEAIMELAWYANKKGWKKAP